MIVRGINPSNGLPLLTSLAMGFKIAKLAES